MPSKLRLEAIDAAHPEVVALMKRAAGVVCEDRLAAAVTRKQVLGARRNGGSEWVIDTGQGSLTLVPFTEVGDAAYTTYLRLS